MLLRNKPGFHAMVQALNPRYQLPHKAIPAMYENIREQILLKMQKEPVISQPLLTFGHPVLQIPVKTMHNYNEVTC